MADHATLETAVQTLLTRYGTCAVAGEESYADAAIDLALFRAERDDAAADRLAKSAEHLLCRIDDQSTVPFESSDSPEWEAASKAVDPYLVAA